MKRRHPDGQVSDLPELDHTLSEDERWYLRSMLGLIWTGSMFHGRFVEVNVARLLGAHVPLTGVREWDLWMPTQPPIKVEVKASVLGGSYKMGGKSADVWVFVTFSDREIRPPDLQYVVASQARVLALGKASMSQKALFQTLGPPVTAASLRDAVIAARDGNRGAAGELRTQNARRRTTPSPAVGDAPYSGASVVGGARSSTKGGAEDHRPSVRSSVGGQENLPTDGQQIFQGNERPGWRIRRAAQMWITRLAGAWGHADLRSRHH